MFMKYPKHKRCFCCHIMQEALLIADILQRPLPIQPGYPLSCEGHATILQKNMKIPKAVGIYLPAPHERPLRLLRRILQSVFRAKTPRSEFAFYLLSEPSVLICGQIWQQPVIKNGGVIERRGQQLTHLECLFGRFGTCPRVERDKADRLEEWMDPHGGREWGSGRERGVILGGNEIGVLGLKWT